MPYLKERYLRTVRQTADQLRAGIYVDAAPLAVTAYLTDEPLPFHLRTEGRRVELHEGDKWARNTFDCGWFHFKGIVPETCDGKPTVLLIDISGEGLIVDAAGEPVQGITCVDSGFTRAHGEPGKFVCPVADPGRAGEPVDVWMDGAANDLFGTMQNNGRVKRARIGVCDERLFRLSHDMDVLVDYLACADEKSARWNQILFRLYDACVSGELAALEEAASFLLAQKGGDAPLRFTAVGHAHIDLGWLWPIRETKRKGARTFATALQMIERYPDYIFGESQPQLYQWMKEDYPGLYARVKAQVKAGRIEPQGCMWVEADANVSGGEALVRQILYGKQFFMEEFGADIKVLWLPDVFGYNAALPQILKKSGNEVFMTQKLSWSQHNKFPHQTFRWRGIDGTEIFTHMLPDETYNSPLLPNTLLHSEENYAESGLADEALILFGVGDGGGGPGVDHLEAAKRVKNLYGLCPVEQAPAQSMLLRLKEKCENRAPVWQGELYLERHQGTFTTAARNKKFNRQMENALRELEFMIALTGDDCREALDEIWKEMLLYQFHDILPGSSIQRVYDESQARYRILLERVEALIRERQEKLSAGRTVFNSLSWDRATIYEDGGDFYRLSVPAMGFTGERGEKIDKLSVSAGANWIENKFIKAVFGEDGALISCFDKRNGREVLGGPSARYALWREENADCWDIAIEYTDRRPDYFALQSQTFALEGARAVCRQRYAWGKSRIEVTARLDEDAEYLAFDMKVDWQEADLMLRTAFDTAVVTDRAGCDIQYGLIYRSNHENTLWDKAQFEVCAHKFVDLSEADWGVALLNDCKYGFRVKGGAMDMNILRAQHTPSELTDRGEHELSFALYPHAGGVKAGCVKERAYEFNMPLRVFEGEGEGTPAYSMLRANGAIVEAIKPAQDGNGLVLRAYEPCGTHARMRIQFNGWYDITPCDLLENISGKTRVADFIQDDIKPFEILSWRLTPRRGFKHGMGLSLSTQTVDAHIETYRLQAQESAGGGDGSEK